MTRIIHFSDIHFGRPDFSLRALFDKRLLGNLNYLARRRGKLDEGCVDALLARCRELSPDLVVCSGDITCVGTPKEFAVGIEKLTPFRDLAGSAFCYVPGNHDAYVRDRSCQEALREACARLNPGLADPHAEFAILEDLPGCAAAMMNQARPVGCLLSSGRISEGAGCQAAAWLERISRAGTGQPRILIGHFPLRHADGSPLAWRRRLRGAAWLAGMIDADRLDLYLCGHIHTPYVRISAHGGVECCAGSLTQSRQFAVIEIDAGGRINHRFETV